MPQSTNVKVLTFAQRTESTREREVFGYLRPWADSYHPHAFPRPSFSRDVDIPDTKPAGCEDTALAAFAQLGATRMKVRRCMISLISSSIEYCLSESTKTLSLQFDSVEYEEDRLWLGTSSFSRNEGIAGLAIQRWRKAKSAREKPESLRHYYTEGLSPHWYIVNDIPCHEELADLPFVKDGGRLPLRFFCAIPIRSHHGSVIGCLSMMDDKPRYGVSAMEMTFMEEMGQTIMKHLDATKASVQRNRGERLIQGLGLFNSGGESLREWWLAQDKEQAHRGRGDRRSNAVEDASRQERANHEFGVINTPQDFERARSRNTSVDGSGGTWQTTLTSRDNEAAGRVRISMEVDSRDFATSQSSSIEAQQEEAPVNLTRKTTLTSIGKKGKPKTNGPNSSIINDFHLPDEIDNAYARASNLIREALGADGAMFLDVNIAPTSKRDQFATRDNTDSRATSASETDPTTTLREAIQDNEGCGLLGFSTRMKSSLKGFQPSKKHLGLSKTFLERMVRKHPNGKIFNFDDRGAAYSSSGIEETSEEDAKALAAELVHKAKLARSRSVKEGAALSDLFDGVQSVAFLPLWDSNSQRYRAGALVWTDTPFRLFDPIEDLTYLAAFGNSVVVELARLETIAADRAKTTFISSVSHELRSPLHGILGGLELLQTTDMNTFQQEMMRTVQLAGITLLDTVSNILDFVKIESLTKNQRKELAKDDLERKSSRALGKIEGSGRIIDLAKLTEDVLDTIVVGRRFQTFAKTPSAVEESKSQPFFPFKPSSSTTIHHPAQQDVSIVLDIDWQPSWRTRILPGQWTRILTNLVGNAIKYTKRGSISVKLSAMNDQANEDHNKTVPVCLVIEDTGIGMSKDYLDHHLYTPFMQENAHSEGTGLGLSIVQQILMTMNGEMRIQSTLGEGTQVTVTFLADITMEPAHGNDVTTQDTLIALESIKDKRLVILTSDQAPSDITHRLHSVFLDSFMKTCSDWFSLRCSYLPVHGSQATADFYAAVTSTTDVQDGGEVRFEPDTILTAVKGHKLPLLVLAPYIDQSSETRIRQNFGNEVVYLDQPIGPRKLLRSLIALASTRDLENASDADTIRLERSERASPQMSDHSTLSDSSVKSLNPMGVIPLPVSPIADVEEAVSRRPSSRHQDGACSQPFFNTLKSRTMSPSKAESGKANPVKQQPRGAPGTYILLVEDNPINMKLLMVLMRRMNLQCQCAENGAIAVQKYTAAPEAVSLILMDMSMPVMNGFKATEKIRAYEKRNHLQRSNITALTGVTGAEARRNAFASGVDRFLAKPVSMKQIEELVDDLFVQQP